jgi:putative FmdB family regulatory protein
MPIFELVCKSCGEEFETLVMGSRRPSCPKCHGEDLDKLLSTFAFRSTGRSGESYSSSGSKCSGCAATSCGTCH